jgi:hypothetical protein
MDKHKYQLEKLANRKTGYPIATIAYYGPENKMASKVVVGIIRSENDKEPLELRKWFARDQDVRNDSAIIHEMIDFIQAHFVYRVAMVDKIIGCPHEEGIDYPLGEVCPHCPYWANRDRFTGELNS